MDTKRERFGESIDTYFVGHIQKDSSSWSESITGDDVYTDNVAYNVKTDSVGNIVEDYISNISNDRQYNKSGITKDSRFSHSYVTYKEALDHCLELDGLDREAVYCVKYRKPYYDVIRCLPYTLDNKVVKIGNIIYGQLGEGYKVLRFKRVRHKSGDLVLSAQLQSVDHGDVIWVTFSDIFYNFRYYEDSRLADIIDKKNNYEGLFNLVYGIVAILAVIVIAMCEVHMVHIPHDVGYFFMAAVTYFVMSLPFILIVNLVQGGVNSFTRGVYRSYNDFTLGRKKKRVVSVKKKVRNN